MTPIFKGTIENGKLTLDQKDKFTKYLANLKGRIELTIKKARKKRTSQQNRYYWGVVIKVLGDELGYDPEEMHTALKIKFLAIRSGKLPTTRSTAKLTSLEFMDYIDQIVRFASQELNINIPNPDEVDYDTLPEWE